MSRTIDTCPPPWHRIRVREGVFEDKIFGTYWYLDLNDIPRGPVNTIGEATEQRQQRLARWDVV